MYSSVGFDFQKNIEQKSSVIGHLLCSTIKTLKTPKKASFCFFCYQNLTHGGFYLWCSKFHQELFIYLLKLIYRWYMKIAFANKFQLYHKIKYNIYYISLHIKHPQSISPIFLILFLNSNNELLDFTTAGRLFHIREPRKWIAFVP